MKKRMIVIALLAVGILLFCISVILAILETAQVDMIGGVDVSTFMFVFFNKYKGVYSMFSMVGIICILIGTAIAVRTHRK